MEEGTTIIFRNGVKLNLDQAASEVLRQLAEASAQGGSLSLQLLTLRGGAIALVSAPDLVAVAQQQTDDGNIAMLPSAQGRAQIVEADRVTELQRDIKGRLIGSISRVVRV